MNRPELYHSVNYLQRHDAEHVIKRFATIIQWRYDGRDSLIDVGSGSGDVLMDFIHPTMPRNFKRVVCSDINPKIVQYAKSYYGHVNKSEFKVLDIESNKDLAEDLKEQFDHVTSFYTMMWVQNYRWRLSLSLPIFEGYKRQSQMERWSKYMTDIDAYIAPLQYSPDPAIEYADYMTQAGFKNVNVELKNNIFTYDSLDDFKANMTAVNPWVDRIPAYMQEEFINDLISITMNIMGLNPDSFTSKSEFSISYKLVIACAKKFAKDISSKYVI